MHHIRQRGISPLLSILGKLMLYSSFNYSHISMTSWLPYLFNYRFLSFDFNFYTILSIQPTFACYHIVQQSYHFLQRVPFYATESVVHNLALYINQDCRDVILHTNHGFTIVATVLLDEHGDFYFGAGFWKEISKFYVLKAGTKIALHIKGPGHGIYANFPVKSIRPDFVRSKCSFQVSAC